VTVAKICGGCYAKRAHEQSPLKVRVATPYLASDVDEIDGDSDDDIYNSPVENGTEPLYLAPYLASTLCIVTSERFNGYLEPIPRDYRFPIHISIGQGC
jgi:hypothetical protein